MTKMQNIILTSVWVPCWMWSLILSYNQTFFVKHICQLVPSPTSPFCIVALCVGHHLTDLLMLLFLTYLKDPLLIQCLWCSADNWLGRNWCYLNCCLKTSYAQTTNTPYKSKAQVHWHWPTGSALCSVSWGVWSPSLGSISHTRRRSVNNCRNVIGIVPRQFLLNSIDLKLLGKSRGVEDYIICMSIIKSMLAVNLHIISNFTESKDSLLQGVL